MINANYQRAESAIAPSAPIPAADELTSLLRRVEHITLQMQDTLNRLEV